MSYEFYYGEDQDDPRHLRHGLTGCTGVVGVDTQPSSRATSTSVVEPYEDDRHTKPGRGGRSRGSMSCSEEEGSSSSTHGEAGGGRNNRRASASRPNGNDHHPNGNNRSRSTLSQRSGLSQQGQGQGQGRRSSMQRRPSLSESVYSSASQSQSQSSCRNFDATKQLALAGVRPSRRSSLTRSRNNSERSISGSSRSLSRGGGGGGGTGRRGSSLSLRGGGGGVDDGRGGGGGGAGGDEDEGNYDMIIRAAARMSLGQGSAASSVLDARMQLRRNNSSFSTGGCSSRRGSDWNLPRLSADQMSQHDPSDESDSDSDDSEEIEIDLDMNGGGGNHDGDDHDDDTVSEDEISDDDDSSHTEEPKELVLVHHPKRHSDDGTAVSDTSSLSDDPHDDDDLDGRAGGMNGGAMMRSHDDDSSTRGASSKDSLDEEDEPGGAAAASPSSFRSAGGSADSPGAAAAAAAAAAPDPFDVMLMSSSDEEDSRGERGSNYAESMLSKGGPQGESDPFLYEGFVDRTERRKEQNVRESVLARRKAREVELESASEDALRPWRRKTATTAALAAVAAVPETVDEEDAAAAAPPAALSPPTPAHRAASTSVVDDRHHLEHRQSGADGLLVGDDGPDDGDQYHHHNSHMNPRRGSGMRYHDNVSLPSHSDIFSLGDAASLGGDGGFNNSVAWTPRGVCEVGMMGVGVGVGAGGVATPDGGVDGIGGGAVGADPHDNLPEEAQQALEALQVQREYENLFENPPPGAVGVAAAGRDHDHGVDDDEYPKEGRKASYTSSLASADALTAATEFAVLSGAIQPAEQDVGHVEDNDDWSGSRRRYDEQEVRRPQDPPVPVPPSHYRNDWSGSGSRSASASVSVSVSESSRSGRSGHLVPGQEQWRKPPPEAEDGGRPRAGDPRYSEATPIIQNRKMGHPGGDASTGSRRSRSTMSDASSSGDGEGGRNRGIAAAAAVGGAAAAVGVAAAAANSSADAPPQPPQPPPSTADYRSSMGDVESQAYSLGDYDDDTTRGDDLSILADAEDMMIRTQKEGRSSANGFASGLGSLHEAEEGMGNPESSLMSLSRQEEGAAGGPNRRSVLKEQKQLSKGNVSVGDETWFGAVHNLPAFGDEGSQRRYLWYLGGFLLFALSLIAGLGVGVAVLKQDDPGQAAQEASPTPGTSPPPAGSPSLRVAPLVGQSINGLADGDTVGSSVSLSSSGTYLAAGASRSNDGGVDSGHVRVFRYDSGYNAWNQLGRPIPGTQRRDFSGYSVSLSGDGMRVAIGSRFHDGPSGAHSGQARVFEYRSGSWVQLGDSMDGEAAGDEAGFCVSLSEDGRRVAVGAWKSDGFNGMDSGSVTVFEYNERGSFGSWNRLGPTIVGKAAGDTFGMSVSLSAYGNLVAIGAPKNDDAGVDSGQAQVFEYRTGFWQRLGNNIDGEDAGEWAGRAVSLSLNGRRLAVGSFGNDRGGTDSGLARVFEYDTGGGAWTQIGSSIRGAPQSQLGGSISLSRNGGRLVVGADRYGAGDVQEVGEVRTYAYSENEWVQLGQAIVGSNYQDRAGNAVSMSADGKFMAMGIYGSDEGGTNAGQARVYSY